MCDLTSRLDPTQVSLLQEQCILVDKNDNKNGVASKKSCHLLENINKGMLHRAFSVFLFNTQGELLIQQRSDSKITFPGHWTNTCCSHPLNNPREIETKDNIGIKRAAQRKLQHELGINAKEVPIEGYSYLTRIHYQSNNVPDDGVWGEHEIDYILIFQGDVNVIANQNEVKDVKFVNQQQLKALVEESDAGATLLTPWFRLIVDNFLANWWANLDNLEPLKNHKTIHRMIEKESIGS